MSDLREALEDAEAAFEFIRLKLVSNLEEPERSAFWKAIDARERCRAALAHPQSDAEPVAWRVRMDGQISWGLTYSNPKLTRGVAEAIPLYTAPPSSRMREALGEIEQLCCHLRQGGPDPMDLQELSDALEQATQLATEALCAGDNHASADQTYRVEYDGFVGTKQGEYVTREGKRGVVLQQIGTKVVHVYNEARVAPVDHASDGKESEGGVEAETLTIVEGVRPARQQSQTSSQVDATSRRDDVATGINLGAAAVANGPSEPRGCPTPGGCSCPSDPTPLDREAIAQIIDPDAFHSGLREDGVAVYWHKRRADALAKADRILIGQDESAIARNWHTTGWDRARNSGRILLVWREFAGVREHVELGLYSDSKRAWVNTYGHEFHDDPDGWAPLLPFKTEAAIRADEREKCIQEIKALDDCSPEFTRAILALRGGE